MSRILPDPLQFIVNKAHGFSPGVGFEACLRYHYVVNTAIQAFIHCQAPEPGRVINCHPPLIPSGADWRTEGD